MTCALCPILGAPVGIAEDWESRDTGDDVWRLIHAGPDVFCQADKAGTEGLCFDHLKATLAVAINLPVALVPE